MLVRPVETAPVVPSYLQPILGADLPPHQNHQPKLCPALWGIRPNALGGQRPMPSTLAPSCLILHVSGTVLAAGLRGKTNFPAPAASAEPLKVDGIGAAPLAPPTAWLT